MAGPNTSTKYSHFSNVDVGGDLIVGDDVTVGGDLGVSGSFTVDTLEVRGDVITGDDLIVPGLTGDAIKIGDSDAALYGWHDMLGYIESRGTGPTDPAWAQIGVTSFWAYDFAINDKVWQVFHVPHDYVPGTDIHIHTHWLPDGTDTNSVKWEYTYTYAHGHNQDAFNLTGTVVTAEEAPPGTQYQHMVTESAAITIPGMEVDGIIMVQVRRITNGGTNNTDEIFVMTSDIHYQSTGLPTANRAPNFYNT